MGRGIYTTDGPFWERSRALVKPIFTRAQFADLETLEHYLKQMMDLVPGDGSSVDILPLLSKLVSTRRCPQKHTLAEQDQFLDTSTAFLFGESVNSLSSKSTINAKDFLSAFTVAQEGASKKIRQGKFRIFVRDPDFETATRTIRAFTESYVDKALALRRLLENKERGILQNHEGPRRVVFLHELAQQLDDKTELRDQLLSVFTAGHESTAIVTSHVFFLLSRHPAVWRRLRKEVVLLDGREPTFEQLKSMNYLRWVINESEISYSIESASGMIRTLTILLALRLFPLVRTNARPSSPVVAVLQVLPPYSCRKVLSLLRTAM